jgi:hypothetical protein
MYSRLHEYVVFRFYFRWDFYFVEHFPKVDLNSTGQRSDRNVIRASFKGVFADFAYPLKRDSWWQTDVDKESF